MPSWRCRSLPFRRTYRLDFLVPALQRSQLGPNHRIGDELIVPPALVGIAENLCESTRMDHASASIISSSSGSPEMDVPSALKHQPLVMGGYGSESYLVRTCNLLELLLGLLFGDDLLVELVRMIHLTQVAVCLAYLDRRRVALHPARGCVRAFARSECGCVSASSPSLSAHHTGHGYPRAVRPS